MARIAFAWELGTAFGHVTACAALARALEANGHTPAFMFREFQQLAAFPECGHYARFQAPLVAREGEGRPQPVSYADILLGCGYRDAATLSGLVSGWVGHFTGWKPDLVVADSAPTALLAARILGLKRVAFGNGFAIPPRLCPLPAFRRTAVIDPEQVAASDAQALDNVNRVVAEFGGSPLEALAQQFETHEDFLCTLPEVDHYGSRPPSPYWGPRFSLDTGVDVRWTYGEGPRVLVYVRNGLPQLDALIEALIANRCRVAAFIPGLDPARRDRLRSAQRIVADRPMRLEPLLRDCDLVVTEGGNLAHAALTSGVAQLILPTQYEQSLTGLRLMQVGSALSLPPDSTPADLAFALRRLLREPGFKSAARAFARRYAGFSPAEQQRRIVLRIEEILAGPILSATTSPGRSG
jgi:hypothetical protein